MLSGRSPAPALQRAHPCRQRPRVVTWRSCAPCSRSHPVRWCPHFPPCCKSSSSSCGVPSHHLLTQIHTGHREETQLRAGQQGQRLALSFMTSDQSLAHSIGEPTPSAMSASMCVLGKTCKMHRRTHNSSTDHQKPQVLERELGSQEHFLSCKQQNSL